MSLKNAIRLCGISALFAALPLFVTGPASALVVQVDATDGPWSIAVNPTLNYGGSGATAPTSVALSGTGSLTISYVSGLTDSFGVGIPIVDAAGYVGGIFGSGVGLTGQGSIAPLPSFFADMTNTGSPVYLNALIGVFVDSSGVVIGSPFAPGNGPFNAVIPVGAASLLLGINDDIFGGGDNSGFLKISVTGEGLASGVPEPSTWALMLLGFAGVGLVHRNRRRRTLAAA